MAASRRVPLGAVLSLLVLATTVPLGAFAAGLIGRAWRHEREVIDRQNIETARAVSVAIDQEVERTIGALMAGAQPGKGRIHRDGIARAARR
jgi:hypothetical protein